MAKVLIVEDEPQVRTVLGGIMQDAGHSVMEAFDGLSGLYEIRDSTPDLVLLDWMIPELVGGEVLNRLRNDPEFAAVQKTPVIIVSDFEDDTSRIKFRRAGADDFVPKRDDPDQLKTLLLETVNKVLRIQ